MPGDDGLQAAVLAAAVTGVATGDAGPPTARQAALAGTARRLVDRVVGRVDPDGPVDRQVAQLVAASRLADRDTRLLAHQERSDLVVSAVLYGGLPKAEASRRAGLTRQAIDQAIQAELAVDRLTGPEFDRARATRRPDLEIEGAADLLEDAAAAVRVADARCEAAAPVRDRLVVLLGERGLATAELAGRTGLKRAMVDRIRARGRED